MRTWRLVASGALAAGCLTPRTEIVLRIDSDMAPAWRGGEVVAVRVAITRADEAQAYYTRRFDLAGAGALDFPGDVGVVPSDPAAAPRLRVLVEGELSRDEVIRREFVTGFTRGRTQVLEVFLASACRPSVAAACPEGSTCRGQGECEPVNDPALRDFAPPARRDAGEVEGMDAKDGSDAPDAEDAPGEDGGDTDPMEEDAGPPDVAEDVPGECTRPATRPCYTGPAGTQGVGRCRAGTQSCERSGRWSMECVGQVTPAPETCNGQDDDCDRMTDEGDPEGGGACATGERGVCASGVRRCMDGRLRCVRTRSPGTELCNNEDDNCDGRVDEMPVSCGGTCTPWCTGGRPNAWQCSAFGAFGAPLQCCEATPRPCTTGPSPGPVGGCPAGTFGGRVSLGSSQCRCCFRPG